MNLARNTTSSRLFLAILFSLLTVVGSGSVAVGDLLLAPKTTAPSNLLPTHGISGNPGRRTIKHWTEQFKNSGKWNADGDFDSGDFILAFDDGGFEKGPKAAMLVPEPTGVFLLLGGIVAYLLHRIRCWR